MVILRAYSFPELGRAILRSMATIHLFTYTDYKTVFFPITMFALVSAPVYSFQHMLQGMLWIWVHLLQCNVSNQYKTVLEDVVNRPWRPIPSGRVSVSSARIIRWCLVPICLLISALYGRDTALISAALSVIMAAHDELKLSGTWIGKNLCNAAAYAVFEAGATKIMGQSLLLDYTAVQSIFCSASIIFTTIQAQDFADVEGDRVLGRNTFPIYAPEASRVVTLMAVALWSALLSWVWDLGFFCGALFCCLGTYVGWRYYRLRGVTDDRSSYVIYNVRGHSQCIKGTN